MTRCDACDAICAAEDLRDASCGWMLCEGCFEEDLDVFRSEDPAAHAAGPEPESEAW